MVRLKTLKIPEATVMRLSLYSLFLEQAEEEGKVTVSSGEIAEGVGVSPAMVRKDLAYFGEFGTRGVGYNAGDLNQQIRRILGLNREWPVVLVGAGKLGSALALYQGFLRQGFHIVGVFDNDPERFGKRLGQISVQPVSQMEEVIRKRGVEMAIITVPDEAAQEVAERLVDAGVKAILNFSSKVLNVPRDVVVRHVDFSVHLGVLTFNLVLLNRNNG
ncbi:MAG TPA: redox-sensing transcriptional repressor Rex [Syntrophomonadaceae bacterium]|nr:redox-sensing transcriptional repressor Rex [Syntrophomonadaceae bacterium]